MPLPTGPNGEVNGSDVLVQLEQPADSGTYVTLASQRGATFAESTAIVDMSSKESRNQRVNPGRYSSTISLEALFVPTSSGYTMMKNAMRNGTYIRLKRYQQGSGIEVARAVITSMSQSAPDQEASVISAEFTIDNGWT